jgi:hypothetical protein
MSSVRPYILGTVVAAALFWTAYDGGSYSLQSRATLAIALWWTIIMAVALGLWPLARPPRASVVAGGFLAAFGLWAGISIAWARSAELAFVEFNRTALFLACFLVAVLAGTRGNALGWANGLATAIAAIGILALASRLFPDVLPQGTTSELLPGRLSWPVEYWNGLAIFVALALPLLLRVATEERALVGSLAVGVIPALAGVLYLTSSRGGFAAAIVGLGAFLVLTPRRWPAGAALGLGLVGSTLAVLVLDARHTLVNAPDAHDAIGQGRSAALLILAVCVATGGAWALGVRFLGRVAVPRWASIAAAAAVVLAVLAGLVAVDPPERFEAFKAPPGAITGQNPVTSHLLSGNGSGRWQFWDAALEEWDVHPLEGRGAGAYEAWWAQHGTIDAFFVRDAHSLYLETLGDLGIVGLVLIAGALLVGVVAGVRRLRASEGPERMLIVAFFSSYLAFLVAAGIDWMWELTVVTVVGMALLGLLTGPATAAAHPPRLVEGAGRSTRRRFAIGIAALVCGWLVICAQAIPFLADLKISASQAAVRRGDLDNAFGEAVGARQLQPWAASPYLQIAQVQEAAGNYPAARVAIDSAIARNEDDWRLWLAKARIETLAGAIAEARESLSHAKELNPRSPLFANVE